MTTSDFGDTNIVEGDSINWRLIVYPVVAAIILILGGLIYYLYLQNQREELEASARAALVQAKTPEALVAVADLFPSTQQATLALLGAARDSFNKKDYNAALRDYQRIANDSDASTDELLRDSAIMGMASTLEKNGRPNDAIKAYLTVAGRGAESPYAPAAYSAAASLYRQQGDQNNEKMVLTQAAGLDPESYFVRAAQQRLKELNSPVANPATGNPALIAPTP
jgi:predicted negative regulator of RcsB-dependent stress response